MELKMALGVITNVSSLSAQRSLAETSRTLETAMERLSSGKRINSASDDAAGLATALRMESQIKGLNMAAKNAGDGQAMVQTVEAALSEVGDMLQRLREISVQAASDTIGATDRTYLNNEKTALLAEIDRIASKSTFNGIPVLDGSLSAQLAVGPGSLDTIQLAQGSAKSTVIGGFIKQDGPQGLLASAAAVPANPQTTAETVTIAGHVGTVTTTAVDDDSAKGVAEDINGVASQTGVFATAKTVARITVTEANTGLILTIGSSNSNVSDTATVAASVSATSYQALVDAINSISGQTGVTAKAVANSGGVDIFDADGDDITIVRTDTNAKEMTIQQLKSDESTTVGTARTMDKTGNNNDSVRVTGMIDLHSDKTFTITQNGTDTQAYFSDGAVSATTISNADLTTRAGANKAIVLFDGAITEIASMRAALGSIDNRLEHTVANLMAVSEATSAAKSRIMDADYAVESANLAKAQVLMQAGTAMLAQANSSPQQVLQLLQ
jgi:flagellin